MQLVTKNFKMVLLHLFWIITASGLLLHATDENQDTGNTNIPVKECKIESLSPLNICWKDTSTEYKFSLKVTPSTAAVEWEVKGGALPKTGTAKEFNLTFPSAGKYEFEAWCKEPDGSKPGEPDKIFKATISVYEVTHNDIDVCLQSKGIKLNAKGGTAPYTYIPVDSTVVSIVGDKLIPKKEGDTKVNITDSNGCKGSFYVEVKTCDDYEEPPEFVIKAIDFQTHGKLRNNKTDFSNNGNKFNGWEWILNKWSHPFTMTKDTKPTCTLIVDMTGGKTGVYKIISEGPNGFNFEWEGILTKDTRNIIKGIKSVDKLENKIHTINSNLKWQILRSGSEIVHEQTSENHKCYVLAGVPYASVLFDGSKKKNVGEYITEKRVSFVVDLCEGLNKAHDCADKFHKFTYPKLNSNFWDRHPWVHIAAGGKAQCIDLAIFMKEALSMLGWKESGRPVYLSVKLNKSVAVSTGDGPILLRRNDRKEVLWYFAGNGKNAYEGALYLKTEGKTMFYGGGAPAEDTALKVMQEIVQRSIWVTDKSPYPIVETAEQW